VSTMVGTAHPGKCCVEKQPEYRCHPQKRAHESGDPDLRADEDHTKRKR